MDPNHQILLQKIEAQSGELAEIKKSLKKIQNYFLWTFIITILVVVLPALGLLIAIPKFLATFSEIQNLGF